MPPKNKRAKQPIAKRALEKAGAEAEEEEEEEEEYQGFGLCRIFLRQQVVQKISGVGVVGGGMDEDEGGGGGGGAGRGDAPKRKIAQDCMLMVSAPDPLRTSTT